MHSFVAIFKGNQRRVPNRTFYKRRYLPAECIGDIKKAVLAAEKLTESNKLELVAIMSDDLFEKLKKGHKLRLVAN